MQVYGAIAMHMIAAKWCGIYGVKSGGMEVIYYLLTACPKQVLRHMWMSPNNRFQEIQNRTGNVQYQTSWKKERTLIYLWILFWYKDLELQYSKTLVGE